MPIVSLMLFIWVIDTKKPELTGIENMFGTGRKSHLFTEFLLPLLEGGLWIKQVFV